MARTLITGVRVRSLIYILCITDLTPNSRDGIHRCCLRVWVYQRTYESSVRCFLECAHDNQPRSISETFRWGPGKHPTHTVHVDDVAGALWASAQWIAVTGRKEADSIAGEEITFKNNKKSVQELQAEGLEGLVGPDRKCIAPCFNLVRFTNFRVRG